MKKRIVIQTARSIEEINTGINNGYQVLIRDVIPSSEIKITYSLERDLNTGEYGLLLDPDEINTSKDGTERVLEKISYYPYYFPYPFAAYLLPNDLAIGDKVLLEDLIEDIADIDSKMHTLRLESAEATWNGASFDIKNKPNVSSISTDAVSKVLLTELNNYMKDKGYKSIKTTDVLEDVAIFLEEKEESKDEKNTYSVKNLMRDKDEVETQQENKVENDILMGDIFDLEDLEFEQRKGLRVIETARSIDEMNLAIKAGYAPLIQQVFMDRRIKVTIHLKKDLKTGEYKIEGNGWGRHISKTKNNCPQQRVYEYYPYPFPLPFAAYLVPPDIKIDEKVVLNDLIEDYLGKCYKSDMYRLLNAEAKWDGEKFIVIEPMDFLDCSMG